MCMDFATKSQLLDIVMGTIKSQIMYMFCDQGIAFVMAIVQLTINTEPTNVYVFRGQVIAIEYCHDNSPIYYQYRAN